MDVTSVQLGKSTRQWLKDYRDSHDLPNYDETLRHLLQASDVEDPENSPEIVEPAD